MCANRRVDASQFQRHSTIRRARFRFDHSRLRGAVACQYISFVPSHRLALLVQLCAKMFFWVVRRHGDQCHSRDPAILRCVSRVTAVQAVCAFLLLNSALSRQNRRKRKPSVTSRAVMSTGSTHAPVKDALSLTITAGALLTAHQSFY